MNGISLQKNIFCYTIETIQASNNCEKTLESLIANYKSKVVYEAGIKNVEFEIPPIPYRIVSLKQYCVLLDSRDCLKTHLNKLSEKTQ